MWDGARWISSFEHDRLAAHDAARSEWLSREIKRPDPRPHVFKGGSRWAQDTGRYCKFCGKPLYSEAIVCSRKPCRTARTIARRTGLAQDGTISGCLGDMASEPQSTAPDDSGVTRCVIVAGVKAEEA